jgi:putative ABC transport system permease protein
MVTHNPELAEKYSTRIVRLLDGELQDDSNPFSEEEEINEINCLLAIEKEKEEKELALIDPNDEKALKEYNKNKNAKEKAKMSLWTAFKLSARNLHSKLKRTIMVIIAGSIGIIGVSAVLAVSQGVRDYIESIQDDLLSGNPIQVTKSGVDYETLMNSNSFSQQVDSVKKSTENGKINVNSIVEYLVQNQKALDSLTFQNEFDENYVSYVLSMPKEYYNTISLRYGMNIDYNVYTDYSVSYNQTNPNYDLKKKYDGAIS